MLQNEKSILENVLEQPVGSDDNIQLEPFSGDAMFCIERELDLKFDFIPGKIRCGSENNNDVKLRIRVGSNVRDSQGFVFDNAILTTIKTALNGATMTTSCEDLAIFAATVVKDNSRTPLKWISVGVQSDFPGQISFTWREREEMPSVKLLKLICDTEASAAKARGEKVYKIERQIDSAPLFRGCGR